MVKSWRKHLQQNVSIYIFNHSPLSKETPSFNTRFFLQDKLHIKKQRRTYSWRNRRTHHRWRGQASQAVTQQYDQVLAKEDKVAIQDAGIPLSAEQVAQIVAQHNVSADTVESSLRAILKLIKNRWNSYHNFAVGCLFIKLQSYGISKRYSSALSETDLEKFYDAFSKSFGGDSNRIMRAIKAAGIDGNRERSLFANLLLGYSDRVALDAYHNSLTMTGRKI